MGCLISLFGVNNEILCSTNEKNEETVLVNVFVTNISHFKARSSYKVLMKHL